MARRQQSISDAFQNYGKRLFSFIRSRVNNDEDAEDILQDVWYQLSSIIGTEPIEQLSAWLFRVSRNRILDKKRKLSTQSLEDLAYKDDFGELVLPQALLADSSDPELEFEKLYFREALWMALGELPENQREVFILNEIEDMTLQEIADRTGENIKTIISRKRYAVSALRKRLEKIYYE